MNRRSQDLLYLLLWTTETLAQPTLRNLTESFEGWADRHGFLRQLRRLESGAMLEGDHDPHTGLKYRLTEAGRLAALGGRDPENCWGRGWDGQWRLVVFDLPQARNSLRVRLRRFLQDQHFGYLQKSVWVTPDPLDNIAQHLRGFGADVEKLILLEARSCGGEPHAAVVQGSWSFDRINQLYREYLEVLGQLRQLSVQGRIPPQRLEQWFRRERDLWFEVMREDPMLPEVLLPTEYLGRKAWQARGEAASTLSEGMAKT